MSQSYETREYEFSHGKKPRGRGQWAFKMIAIFGYEDIDMDTIYFANGTLAEAKANVKEQLAKKFPGATHISMKVMP